MSKRKIDEKKNYDIIIKKSNDLVEARHNWSLNEQRLLLLMATDINEIIKDKKEWKIRISEFDKFFKKTRTTKPEAEKMVNSIYDQSMEFKDEKGNWVKHRVISSAKYYNGEITLTLTDFMIPHLRELESRFTQYRLKDVSNFRSQYSTRLYELAIFNMHKTNSIDLELDETKLNLGVDLKKYKDFKSFRVRVLDVAIKEINEISNLIMSYTPIKKGAKVIGVHFEFYEKLNEEAIKESENIEYLRKYVIKKDLSDRTLRSLLKTYTVEQIIRKYYIMSEQSAFVMNKTAFMYKALREDYEEDEKDYDWILTRLEWKLLDWKHKWGLTDLNEEENDEKVDD